jgi:hypothetical protein
MKCILCVAEREAVTSKDGTPIYCQECWDYLCNRPWDRMQTIATLVLGTFDDGEVEILEEFWEPLE